MHFHCDHFYLTEPVSPIAGEHREFRPFKSARIMRAASKLAPRAAIPCEVLLKRKDETSLNIDCDNAGAQLGSKDAEQTFVTT
jgi:hypothetical protein